MDSVNVSFIIFVIFWIMIGCIFLLIRVLVDMRGEDFKENYFKEKIGGRFIILILAGPMSLPLYCLTLLLSEMLDTEHPYTKMLWIIANRNHSSKEKGEDKNG